MKKILKKKVDNLDFYKIFKPELTPKRMMEYNSDEPTSGKDPVNMGVGINIG